MAALVWLWRGYVALLVIGLVLIAGLLPLVLITYALGL